MKQLVVIAWWCSIIPQLCIKWEAGTKGILINAGMQRGMQQRVRDPSLFLRCFFYQSCSWINLSFFPTNIHHVQMCEQPRFTTVIRFNSRAHAPAPWRKDLPPKKCFSYLPSRMFLMLYPRPVIFSLILELEVRCVLLTLYAKNNTEKNHHHQYNVHLLVAELAACYFILTSDAEAPTCACAQKT